MSIQQTMALLLCIAAALMLFVLYLSYQRRHLQAARTIIWMMAAAICYSLGYAFEILSGSLREVKLSYHIQYLGIPFVSAFWLALVFQFSGFASRSRNWLVIGIFVLPVATFLLHLTNDWHNLVYKAFIRNESDTALLYYTVKGPWYLVHVIYNYTILVFGILLFVPMYLRAVPIIRKQIVVLIAGALAPMLFNIAYMFNGEIDLTPFGFALSGLVYAWGIFRFRLLRLTPLAYAKLFETMRDGVILLDYENQIVSHNVAAAEAYPELATYDNKSASAEKVLANSPELRERLVLSSFKDERFPIERVLNGRTRHYMCSLSYIYDNTTIAIGKMVTLSDVTELKVNEERLREKSERLTKLNEFKDKLFTVIAHDIRDPIALLISLTELLEEDGEEPDKTKSEVLPEIKRQVHGTYQLVDNLLNWYRSQNGKVAFRPIDWNLRQVVRQGIALAGARAALKNIQIVEHIDERLIVYADKEMLDLILRNLLSNAIKYSEIGEKIIINAKLEGQQMIISITDNGSGIDEETAWLLRHDELFLKKSGANISDDGGEMRFGLVLTREFVRMHGGSLQFESEAGRGTTFTFTLSGYAGIEAEQHEPKGVNTNERIAGG